MQGSGKTTGCVLRDRAYAGLITPTKLTDKSRWGNDGVYTAITDVQLPSGLWVRQGDGSTSITTIPLTSSLTFNRAITIAAWINTTVDQACGTIGTWAAAGGNRRNGYKLYQEATPRFAVGITLNYQDRIVLAATPAVGTWYHLVGRHDGTNLHLYLNGEVGATPVAGTQNPWNAPSGEFYADRGYDGYHNGYTALCKIWNYALTPAQIRVIYQSEKHWFGG